MNYIVTARVVMMDTCHHCATEADARKTIGKLLSMGATEIKLNGNPVNGKEC